MLILSFLCKFLRPIENRHKSYELSDQDVNKLIIVTQNGGRKQDRSNKFNWTPYFMSPEMASTINDGLHYYEQNLIGQYQADVSL